MNTNYRPTWAEINLANLAFNYRRLKRLAGKNVKMLAAVKANAYGHGMIEVSRTLERCGVNYFGVASVDEAVQLRQAGITSRILVLGAVISREEVRRAAELDLTLTVTDYRAAMLVNRCAGAGRKLDVHIKIDTGMGRLGIWHEEALPVIIRITRLPGVNIEGIYTHCPSADTDRAFTRKQLTVFNSIINRLREQNIYIPVTHAANSSALCRLPGADFTMVRPGLMLYGMYPHRNLKKKIELKPVLSFKTRIVFLKKARAGRSISYGRTYITNKNSLIATIPVGYADGYCRALSNRAYVLVNGARCPVIGRVCMDQALIDVTSCRKAAVGDIAVLIGRQGVQAVSAETLADLCSTIPYEITCRISSRVPRMFKNY